MKDNKAKVLEQHTHSRPPRAEDRGGRAGGLGGGGGVSELAEVEDMIWQLTPSVCLKILTPRLEVELRSFPRPAGPEGLGCQVPPHSPTPSSPEVLQGRERAQLHPRCSGLPVGCVESSPPPPNTGF